MASSSGNGGSRPGNSLSSSGDTSLWLHNKLGTSNDSWTGGSIVSQLSPETFLKIHQCFQDLQPQVKLKLLLSLFHIPKRNLEAWKFELGKILDVGKEDSEPWVCMLAEIMQTYPTTGQLNSDISVPESNKRIFTDLLNDIRKALKKTCDTSDSVLPLECHYLNKNAFISVVGHQPQTLRHFTLKRKPKAAALRAELLNKSADAANKVKSLSSGGFPIRKSTMPRKMDSSASLKSLGSRLSSGGFRNSRLGSGSSISNPPGSRVKKEGGVKLLDINEQPLGYNLSKKRKRLSEMEEAAPPSTPKAKETPPSCAPPVPVKPTSAPTATPVEPPATPSAALSPPEYAAGLGSLPSTTVTSSLVAQPPPPSSSTPSATPAYAPPVYAPPPPPKSGTLTIVSSVASLSSLTPYPPTTTQVNQGSPLGQPLGQQRILTLPPSSRLVQLPTHPLPQSRIVIPSAPGSAATILGSLPPAVGQSTTTTAAQVLGGNPPPPQASPRLITPVTVRPVLQPHIVTNATPTTQKSVVIPSSPAPPVRRGLTLTKELMHEAQEMFRTANMVTRPEKALILGFMAGSRDNPCPHLGNLVTIKLSEDQENVPQKDGTNLSTVIETHFQMNYSTGQWKCIKKYRRLDD